MKVVTYKCDDCGKEIEDRRGNREQAIQLLREKVSDDEVTVSGGGYTVTVETKGVLSIGVTISFVYSKDGDLCVDCFFRKVKRLMVDVRNSLGEDSRDSGGTTRRLRV